MKIYRGLSLMAASDHQSASRTCIANPNMKMVTRVTPPSAVPFLLFVISVLWSSASGDFLKGFKATPNPSVSSFQPLLDDPSGNFSLGFLRVNTTQLDLAVLHMPSRAPLWMANLSRLARWSRQTQLLFNGSLVISDQRARSVFWTTGTEGDRVVLLNTSNLQIQKVDVDNSSRSTVVWQSFDFPIDTIVESQNFTATMSLVSSNGLYSMRLGNNFIGLYAKFGPNKEQLYWKHKALEAKANIVDGNGPIHVQLNPNGYLGMYQTGNTPVDVEAFSSFQRGLDGFLMVRLEQDGNLKGYYWHGSQSNWVLDYQAITETCDLPNACGAYGLCTPGSGCSCLDNQTEYSLAGGCSASYSSDDLCSGGEAGKGAEVLRKEGVELAFKELMGYKTTSSQEECESSCLSNCSCYGAVYNNASGFCYMVDYPIRTLVGVDDESKVGIFKAKLRAKEGGENKKIGLGVGVLGGVILCLVVLAGFGGYRIWRRRRGVKRMLVEEAGGIPGPYKDLGSASFRSIEMGTWGSVR